MSSVFFFTIRSTELSISNDGTAPLPVMGTQRGDFTWSWFANYYNDHITLAPEAADPSGMVNSLLQKDYKVLGEGRSATWCLGESATITHLKLYMDIIFQ